MVPLHLPSYIADSFMHMFEVLDWQLFAMELNFT